MTAARRWQHSPVPGRQQGLALFISLIVLLIITIIGVSGIQTTVMEERMAANARDHDLAFQAAEAGLLAGETLIESLGPVDLITFSNNANGRYETDDAGAVPHWQAVDWASTDVLEADAVGGTSQAPRFIVEHVTQLVPAEDALNISNIGEQVGAPTEIFRVTAFGSGGSASASVLLQSTYGKIL